jgi:hypothetical protein
MSDFEDTALRRFAAPVIAGACFSIVRFGHVLKIDSKHPPSDLGTFFATAAALLGTFFIALALLAVNSSLAGLRIKQIIGYPSYVYIALGAAAAVSGTIESWPYVVYPYFLAITTGAGSAVLIAVTRVGIENLRIQGQEAISRRAQELGRSSG